MIFFSHQKNPLQKHKFNNGPGRGADGPLLTENIKNFFFLIGE